MPNRITEPPKFSELPDMVQVNVAAAYLGVSPQAVYQDLKRGGNLRSYQIGRRILVRKGSLPAPEIESD
jgi:hypothetical protein